MSSKSKAMLPREPLISSRIEFLRPVANRVASNVASAPPVKRPRKIAASSTVTSPRPVADLGGQPVHRAGQRPLAHERLGDGADAGDPLAGDEVRRGR